MPNLPHKVEFLSAPSTEGRLFYVTMINTASRRFAYLYGPCETHQAALDTVNAVAAKAGDIDPRCAFMSFGTASLPADYGNPPVGKLNQYFN